MSSEALLSNIVPFAYSWIYMHFLSAYRAHTFEKNFWEYLNNMISNIGKGKATVFEPETVTEL
ncbi:MAG TPA: hypothetical protein VEH06_15895 [Candidatus Bathyarchaeia archaeon]|nr:hypothetical protein [Candidatus Bathyarchaeia archaeon]